MSYFSKSSYVWLASVIRDITNQKKNTLDPETYISYTNNFINQLTNALEKENQAFNKQRFLDAIYKSPITKEPRPDPEMTGDCISKYDYEL